MPIELAVRMLCALAFACFAGYYGWYRQSERCRICYFDPKWRTVCPEVRQQKFALLRSVLKMAVVVALLWYSADTSALTASPALPDYYRWVGVGLCLYGLFQILSVALVGPGLARFPFHGGFALWTFGLSLATSSWFVAVPLVLLLVLSLTRISWCQWYLPGAFIVWPQAVRRMVMR
ncbi:MAG TPA: hypothetical protein VGE59_03965 [Patescibacteria group bacterium]